MRRDDYRALLERRNQAMAEARDLDSRATREGRRLTDAEQREWDRSMREIEALNAQVEAARAEQQPASNGSDSAATYRTLPGSFETTASDRQLSEAVRSINKGESRALSTAASVSPGELSNRLFDRLRAASVVLNTGVKTLETEADSVTYPALTADAAPAWTSEAAAITPSDPTLDSIVATPRKLAALVQASNEVIDDSDPSLAQVLNDHLVKVLALKLDAGLLEGSGVAPEPAGLKNITGIQTVVAGANGAQPTFDIFADAIAALEAVNVPRERIRIVAHPRNVAVLRKAKASTAGSYLWQDVGDAEPATVFGAPIVATPQLSTDEAVGTSGAVTNSAYVYDTESVVAVWRSPIEVEVDRSRLFNSDQSEFRAKLRADLISPTPTGIVRVTGLLA